MRRRLIPALIALLLAGGGVARAQGMQPQGSPPGTPPGAPVATQVSPMSGMGNAATSPADRSFAQGMAKMNQDMMAVHNTGNTDRDFLLNMMPHHQGAIDMAETELRYGKDETLRRLAQNIVVNLRHEIGQMKAWLTAHPNP